MSLSSLPLSMKLLLAALFGAPSAALLVGTHRQPATPSLPSVLPPAVWVSGPAPAPAATPGVSAATPDSQKALSITFELANVNYDDLEKEMPKPPTVQQPEPIRRSTEAQAGAGFGGNTWDGLSDLGESIADGSRALSKAVADTAEAYTDHVNERLQDGSEVVSEATSSTAEGIHAGLEATGDAVQDGISGGFQGVHEAVHEFIQSSHLSTASAAIGAHTKLQILVADVMEDAIRNAFQDTIAGQKVAPGPAPSAPGRAPASEPGPAPALAAPSGLSTGVSAAIAAAPSLLAPAPAPFFAPSPAVANHVNIFVEFHPGSEKHVSNASASSLNAPPPVDHSHPGDDREILRHSNPHKPNDKVGRTTKVDVVITGEAGTGHDELPYVNDIVLKAASSGNLGSAVSDALCDVIGFKPKVVMFFFGSTQIKQWSVKQCAAHMTDVVAKFSLAYTRRMVPMAIFNECTNFATTMSFSNDRFPTMLDVARCRGATVNFAKRWNYGQGATAAPAGLAPTGMSGLQIGQEGSHVHHKEAATDMTGFCVDICEQKFGSQAPQCHVTEGDRNALRGH